MDSLEQLSVNPIAKVVKIVDLKDNSNLERITTVTNKDINRVNKNKQALIKQETQKSH